MRLIKKLILLLALSWCNASPAQTDTSSIQHLSSIPAKYFDAVSAKATKYYRSISSKTEKTLTRLAKWEEKIKSILEKVSPQTAQRLFAPGQLTFSAALEQFRTGKAVAEKYMAVYDEYRDKVTTLLKYIDQKKDELNQKIITPLKRAKASVEKLNEQVASAEAVQQFIKVRKKQLLEQAIKYLGKSKYLKKINKEAYYYAETLRNYKEVFSDPQKIEKLAVTMLLKTKLFQDFMKKNSMLASLFRMPGSGDPASSASLAGLQTRAQVNNLIQRQVASGGPNAQQQIQQNIQDAQSQLNQLKDKVLKMGGGSSDADMPEGFKPNSQKTKSFLKRLEYGTNIQSQKASSFFPTTIDIGLSVGYKLNDKSIIGIGMSYKMGLGRGWNNIKFSSEGVGLRSFIDWKIKKNIWLSGGYEMNYRSALSHFQQLRDLSGWQRSGLIGVSKNIPVKTKFFKKTKLMLLWDFLSYQQLPRTQPIVFRIGYGL